MFGWFNLPTCIRYHNRSHKINSQFNEESRWFRCRSWNAQQHDGLFKSHLLQKSTPLPKMWKWCDVEWSALAVCLYCVQFFLICFLLSDAAAAAAVSFYSSLCWFTLIACLVSLMLMRFLSYRSKVHHYGVWHLKHEIRLVFAHQIKFTCGFSTYSSSSHMQTIFMNKLHLTAASVKWLQQ